MVSHQEGGSKGLDLQSALTQFDAVASIAAVKAQIERKAFRGSEFLYTLRLASGEQVLAHVPSHHDHQVGERIGIRPQVDHVVTFARQ